MGQKGDVFKTTTKGNMGTPHGKDVAKPKRLDKRVAPSGSSWWPGQRSPQVKHGLGASFAQKTRANLVVGLQEK